MNEKKWVRYKNDPNGTKWEVLEEHAYGWKVAVPRGMAMGSETWFPKLDCILCPPPERWTDVTADCRLTEGIWPSPDGTSNAIQVDSYILWRASSHASGYRLRKVQVNLKAQLNEPENWAFIVEKLEEQS